MPESNFLALTKYPLTAQTTLKNQRLLRNLVSNHGCVGIVEGKSPGGSSPIVHATETTVQLVKPVGRLQSLYQVALEGLETKGQNESPSISHISAIGIDMG